MNYFAMIEIRALLAKIQTLMTTIEIIIEGEKLLLIPETPTERFSSYWHR
jgi:hypothetical protein